MYMYIQYVIHRNRYINYLYFINITNKQGDNYYIFCVINSQRGEVKVIIYLKLFLLLNNKNSFK